MNKIKLYRGKAGLTQTQLAKKLGITKTCEYMYESEKRIKPATMKRIAETLGNCTAYELYGEDIFYVTPESDKDIRSAILLLASFAKDEDFKQELIAVCSEKM